MSKHSPGPKVGRHLALGEQVSRIAERIAGGVLAGPALPTAQVVSSAIRARRLRHQYFAESLFGEPAWDMLLGLLQAQIDGQRLTVVDLCEAAGTPPTTTIRWLNVLVAQGLIRRQADPHDAKTELVELESRASAALRQYFDELSNDR